MKGKKEIDRLRSVHTLYDLKHKEWDFFMSAYQGGKEFAKEENLFRHVRENMEDYKDRVMRLTNMPYCASLVDFFTSFIFKEPIERSPGTQDAWFTEFLDNVDMCGNSMDDFMKIVHDESQIYGHVFILVDAPKPSATVATKADEKELGIRPYFVIMRPQEVIDWNTDKFGKLVYVKRREFYTEHDKDYLPVEFERYTEITPTEYKVTVVDATKLNKPVIVQAETIPNTLGKVPVHVVKYKADKVNPVLGVSFLNDLAYSQRRILNLTSLLDEFLYRQAFNVLAKQVDSTYVPEQFGDGTVEAGTANLMEYTGDKAPVYLSPPVAPAEFIQRERAQEKEAMFLIAAQDVVSELFNGDRRSGFSQAQSFSRTVPFIASRAETLEKAENALFTLVMEMVNQEWKGWVKYKDKYELTNLTDSLTQFLMLARDLGIKSDTFVKKELKRLVRAYDGKLEATEMAAIDKEIDQMSFDSWYDRQTHALVGRGNSPGEQQKPKQTGTMQEVSQEATKTAPAETNKLK